MKVLVTGGAGYIGYDLVRSIHKEDEIKEIIVYDNLSRTGHLFFTGGGKLPKVKFVKGDILDTYSLHNALKGVDIVYHLAAFVSQPYNHLQNLQYEQINRWGTLNLCRIIRESKTVKKAIYLSSTAVYGFGEIADTGAPPSPDNAYGESKFHGEQYFETLHNHCETLIHRAANVFGYNPCLRTDSVLNSWVLDALIEGKFNIYGSGDQFRAFVPIGQLTESLVRHLSLTNSHGIELSILFCASLNQVKEMLLTHCPETEFTYLNRNQIFPSQHFLAYGLLDEHKKTFVDHLARMKEVLI